MRMKKTAKVNELVLEQPDVRALERAEVALAWVGSVLKTYPKHKAMHETAVISAAGIRTLLNSGPTFDLNESSAAPDSK